MIQVQSHEFFGDRVDDVGGFGEICKKFFKIIDIVDFFQLFRWRFGFSHAGLGSDIGVQCIESDHAVLDKVELLDLLGNHLHIV